MNFFKQLGKGAWQVLRTVAPTVAATAAGPFAPLVMPIMKLVFGDDAASDPAKLNSALLNATPQQLVQLRQEEDRHIEKLKELGIEKDKLAYDDVASARSMEMETKDRTPARLAWLVILGFLGMIAGEFIAMVLFPARWGALPRDAMVTIGTAFGYLANEAKQATAFYFGGRTRATDAKS